MGEVTQSKNHAPAKNREPAPHFPDPFSAFRAEMDKMFHSFLQTPAFSMQLPFAGFGNGAMMPSADMKESETEYKLTAELPGLAETDVELSVQNGNLVIKGEKTAEQKEDKENYHMSERRYGAFNRSFRLPGDVDEAKIKAAFDKGVLSVTLPKSKNGGHQSRTIKIGS